ncbi:glycosyltransferase family 39 protein [Microlunatus sp. Gsoil 973]|uniref:glycosyltransferase family 39 protein n=1 Tax=Microlunatus sp. Gsoil 973 TaxID=2672569 RepID=UPI0012B4A039|nr:glycosyltransferase family 39 protein [Microlunatus sp. Gsoil 973]QGN31969.1 hypothetical protein GJV80_03210 [Microlunatus sp. Gsoil 973]
MAAGSGGRGADSGESAVLTGGTPPAVAAPESSAGRVGSPLGCFLAAGGVALLLMIFSGRYGFHRDEYYFIESGHHLAWAQPDNPMLVPYLAAGWSTVVGDHLWAFRLLPALAAGCYVLISGLVAGELGGGRAHQVAASVATALTGLVLATGHLFSTETFDMTISAAALWLVIRAVRTDSWRAWTAAGILTGIAMEIRMMAIFVIAASLAAILVLGPRRVFAGPKLWLSAAVALVLAAPNLIWQAIHGWPMRLIASNIAAGGSTSSTARAGVVPSQLLIIGPILCVVLIIGVGWLLRRRRRRQVGWLSLGYLIFLAVVVVTGGKAYYPSPFFPALMAAGAIPLLDALRPRLWRRVVAVALLAVSAIVTPLLLLPIAPVGSTLFQVGAAVNPDSAETVGWNGYTATVARVARSVPPDQRAATVIITANYGEAGSLSLARRERTADGRVLPPVYSGHNGFGLWGPPPESATTVIAVGDLGTRWPEIFTSCRRVATLESPPGVDNQEAGAPVQLCSGRKYPWSRLWPLIRHLS